MQSVLVVDDEPAVRESLRMLFKRECRVETAEDLTTHLDRAHATPGTQLIEAVIPPLQT